MKTTISIETFRDIRGYYLNELARTEPSGRNSLNYKKYKVTVEEIEENKEIYQERLQKIYNEKHSGFRIKSEVLKEAEKLGINIVK